MITEKEIQAAVDYIRDNSGRLAQAKAHRVLLEEHRKITKARLMKKAETEGVTSAAAQEREAYASEEYETHIKGLSEAVRQETEIQTLMAAATVKIDAWRTQEASNRRVDRA